MTAEIVTDEKKESLFSETSLLDRLKGVSSLARTLEMSNEWNFQKISSFYADAKHWERKIECARKEANAPDQERINARNDKAREIVDLLKEIQSVAKQKTEEYQQHLEQKKQKEIEGIKQAVDVLGLDEMPYIPPEEKSIKGSGAIAYIRTVRKFRIVDLHKVPLKYLQVNEDLIKTDIKLGIDLIPGIEVYEEQITQLKTR